MVKFQYSDFIADCLLEMNPYGRSSSRSDASSSHSSPTSSSMYSTASSGISECFLAKVERLSDDSEDDESKSSHTTSSSGHYSDESWDFKKKMKANGLPRASESRHRHKKSKKSKKSKRKRSSPDPEDDDFVKAKWMKTEKYEECAPVSLPKISKKKRHTAETAEEKRGSEPSPNAHTEVSSVMGSNVQKMMVSSFQKIDALFEIINCLFSKGEHFHFLVSYMNGDMQEGDKSTVFKNLSSLEVQYYT